MKWAGERAHRSIIRRSHIDFSAPHFNDPMYVYYISNDYNRNAGLTVNRWCLLLSIYVTIPFRRRAAAKINIEKRANEGILEGIDISKPHLSTVKPAFLLYSFKIHNMNLVDCPNWFVKFYFWNFNISCIFSLVPFIFYLIYTQI